MVIPQSWDDWLKGRMFYEKLVDPVEVSVKARSVPLTILVEPPQAGFAHACTVDDIVQLLQLIPVAHFEKTKLIVLRQPKRKERILASVWGRLVYWSEIGKHSGAAIYLEARNVSRPRKWGKSLTPDWARELDRLREDGHEITSDKRNHLISSTLDSVRSTQLYRTLPHEVGHYVDYLRSVEYPSRENVDKWLRLNDLYHGKPEQEREAFAHRYADEFRQRETDRGFLPFDRILDADRIRQQGLEPEWFGEN